MNISPAVPNLDFRFCHFYAASGRYHLFAGYDVACGYVASPDSAVYLNLEDCNLKGGRITLGKALYSMNVAGAVTWVNNLFDNVTIDLDPGLLDYDDSTLYVDLSFQANNNLFRGGGWFHLEPIPASAGNWGFKDNLFDRVNFYQDTDQPLALDNNAYWPLAASDLAVISWEQFWWGGNSAQLTPTITGGGAQEVTLTAAPPYQAGPFGNFYLPNTTPLYGAGSDTPANLGLYHYTTRIDQMKEGDEPSGHMVNIGVHYVAANNYGQPLDSDGDGIPDYVEDANGNGVVDANETDWTTPTTVSGVLDSTNSVYDDFDLSGDGLVGRIKKALGMNPFDTSNPLTLTQVITGQEPDIVTFEVPVSYNLLMNIGSLHLLVDGGQAASFQECDRAADGNCLLLWNTTFDSPGQHYVQAQLILNGQIHQGSTPDPTILTGVGKLGTYYSTNICQFDPFYSSFDSGGAILYAKTPACPDADYTIELQTESGAHIKTLTNSTSTGVIQTNWDLTDDNGNTVTNDTVKAIFHVTLLDPSDGSLEF
jgi:hypothetical protein